MAFLGARALACAPLTTTACLLYSRRICKERWSMRLKPLATCLMVGKLTDQDTVDGRRSVTDTLDLVARSFPESTAPANAANRRS